MFFCVVRRDCSPVMDVWWSGKSRWGVGGPPDLPGGRGDGCGCGYGGWVDQVPVAVGMGVGVLMGVGVPQLLESRAISTALKGHHGQGPGRTGARPLPSSTRLKATPRKGAME